MGAIAATKTAIAARIEEKPAVAAVVLMVCSTMFLASMHGSVRFVSAELHAFEIAFFRNVFGFAVLIPLLVRIGISVFVTRRFHFHMARGVLNGSSMLCWFLGLSLIPLADATALSLSSPLIASFAAIVILGERMRTHRWVGLGLGVLGMLIILRPGFEEVGLGAILIIGSAFLVTGSKLIAKTLTKTESPTTIVAWLTFLMIPVTAGPAALVWQTPTWEQLLMLLGIGALGSTGHLLMVNAYRLADVSLVEPMIFCRLVWASIFGVLVFAEIPDLAVWLGGALIVGATTYVARRETGKPAKS